jgi:UDP-N-acetylmuramoyl-tripeptide--D-alanyl-D-alanine ligase
VNGRLQGSLPNIKNIDLICTDSRKIMRKNSGQNENILFVPLKGKNFDGHEFIKQAFDNGASLAIAEENADVGGDLPVIRVKDTAAALQDIAAFYLKKFNLKVVGITGSVGKSTVKEMVASILSTNLKIIKNEKNFNGQIGLPLTVFEINEKTEVLVAEMGISRMGEMENLVRVAPPDFAIVTNIGVSHLEYFKTTEITCREKLKIAKKSECKLYLNGDNPELSKANPLNKVVYFGLNGEFPYGAEQIYTIGETTEFVLVTENFSENIKIPCLGIHNVYNALAAVSLAIDMGIHLDDVKKGIENFVSLPQRGQIIHIGDIILMNDSYNASPDSVKSSVHALQAIKSGGKTIVVIADILELGVRGEEIHFDIGKHLASVGIDILITVGKLAKCIQEGARAINPNIQTSHFADNKSAAQWLIERAAEGDKILIKGSRGMKTEEIADKFILSLK